MPTLTNYQTYKLNAYAVVHLASGDTTLDLLRFSTTFELNSVPTASASLILGRNTVTGEVANIHNAVDQLTTAVRIDIYLKVTVGPNSYGFAFERWPTGFFRAFQGLITSTGYTRTRDNVTFNINMVHWLNDLEFSSALSRSVHTLTPQQMNNLAGGGLDQGVNATPGQSPAFTHHGLAAQYMTTDNIDTDLWGLAIGPWLKALCDQDVLSDDNDTNLDHNTEGLAALKKFEPFVYEDQTNATNNGYYYGTQLALPISQLAGAESISSAIAQDIGEETFSDIAGTTLWHKLVGGYGASYDFRLVPLVNTALIVPQIAGQRTAWQVIYGEEYSAIDVNVQMPRPVKGVRLFTGSNSPQGAQIPGQPPGDAGLPPQVGGRYDNPDYTTGMIISQNAPRWAANIVNGASFGDAAAAPFVPRGNGVFPGLGRAPTARPAAIVGEMTALWDAVARAIYVGSSLHGRSGTLQGKLRFDVAPGSTIEIRCVEDKFVRAAATTPASSVLFAEVRAVGVQVDAESSTASTTFRLMNVRTATENTTDATSIDYHPLYDNPWRGAPLVEDLGIFIPKPSQVFGDAPTGYQAPGAPNQSGTLPPSTDPTIQTN